MSGTKKDGKRVQNVQILAGNNKTEYGTLGEGGEEVGGEEEALLGLLITVDDDASTGNGLVGLGHTDFQLEMTMEAGILMIEGVTKFCAGTPKATWALGTEPTMVEDPEVIVR